jgi:hypothetical protein
MATIHTHVRQIERATFDRLEQEIFKMAEYPGTDEQPVAFGEVEGLMEQSRRSDLVVRFHDSGFPISTAWRWLADGIGLAYMIANGGCDQVHLLVSAMTPIGIARQWLQAAGVDPDSALPSPIRPSIITLEREGYADEPGGFLLAMILFAPFDDCCGITNDPT